MSSQTRVRLLTAITIVAIVPLLITWWLPHHYFKTDLRDYVPCAVHANDATLYWLEINAFSKTGFNSGYFGREEDIARCPLVRFGWQNFAVYIYGSLAALLGWELWSSVIWNPIILGIALFFFLTITRCRWKQIIVVGLLMMTFWSILFYLPSMLVETFHYFITVMTAAGFSCVLNSRNKIKKHALWLTTALLFIGTVARPSWAPLLFLSTILAVERWSWKSFFKAIFVGFMLCCTAYGLFLQMQPDPSKLFTASGAIMAGEFSFQMLITNLYNNIKYLAVGNTLQIFFRIQVGLILGVSIIGLLIGTFRNRNNLKKWVVEKPDWIIHTFNLFSIIVLTLLVYMTSSWGDFRLIGIYVLFSCLLAIARKSAFVIPIIVVVTNLFMAPMFLEQYQIYKGLGFCCEKTKLNQFAKEINPFVQYNPEAEPWDNTLLYGSTILGFPTELISLPAGIGMRIIIVPVNLQFPIHSRYVLLDKYLYNWISQYEDLFYLTSTCIGDLYYCARKNESAFKKDGSLKGDPNNSELNLWLGNIYQKKGELALAIKYYERALKHDPQCIKALQNLAFSLALQGKDNEALEVLMRINNTNPENADTLYNIACIYAKQYKIDESVMWLEKAIKKGFNNWKLMKKDPDLDNIRDTPFMMNLIKDH